MIVAKREFRGSLVYGDRRGNCKTYWSELTSNAKHKEDPYETTGEDFMYYGQAVLKFIASLPPGSVIAVVDKPKKAETTVFYHQPQPAHNAVVDTVLAPGANLVTTPHHGGTGPEAPAEAGPSTPGR